MKKRIKNYLKISYWLILLLPLLPGCVNDPVEWDPDTEEQVISEYVGTYEEFSEFFKLIESTKVSSILAVRGPYTLFLPNNDAMNTYYAEKGISSYLDLSEEKQYELAMNHIINGQITSGSIGLGALIEVNGIDDYIVSEFEGADIILNKYSKIIDLDVEAANGVVHVINRVIDPVTKSVYDLLSDDPSYSIFKQGIDLAGLKDTLQVISFPFGQYTARTRFTILAIADSTYNRFGINSVNDLIAKYTDDTENLTDMNNGFYRYMEYHCISGTYYLSDLEIGSNLYPILSFDNNVSITVDDDYKINQDIQTKKYTPFAIEQCNIPGKNGTIHQIVGLLPVTQPKPTTLVWETTDHFDLKQSDYFGKTYERFFDGENRFENIHWEGSYLLYYFKDHDTGDLLNDDCLSMSGWWWCEVTTPKIMKGRYKLTSNLWANNIDYAVFVDGVNTAYIKKSDPAKSTSWGIFDWEKTEPHTIRVVANSAGILFWDTLIFTPEN